MSAIGQCGALPFPPRVPMGRVKLGESQGKKTSNRDRRTTQGYSLLSNAVARAHQQVAL